MHGGKNYDKAYLENRGEMVQQISPNATESMPSYRGDFQLADCMVVQVHQSHLKDHLIA